MVISDIDGLTGFMDCQMALDFGIEQATDPPAVQFWCLKATAAFFLAAVKGEKGAALWHRLEKQVD